MISAPALPWYRAYAGTAAEGIGLIPIAWCAWRYVRHRVVDPAYWYVAAALALSWVADVVGHHVRDPWLPSTIYPVLQAAMIGAVMPLTQREAEQYVVTMIGVGIAGTILWHGVGPDIFIHTVAFLSIAGLALGLWRHDRLRTALLVLFGLGWLAYVGLITDLRVPGAPRWFAPGWWAFQAIRLIGALLVCRAISEPHRQIEVMRAARVA